MGTDAGKWPTICHEPPHPRLPAAMLGTDTSDDGGPDSITTPAAVVVARSAMAVYVAPLRYCRCLMRAHDFMDIPATWVRLSPEGRPWI